MRRLTGPIAIGSAIAILALAAPAAEARHNTDGFAVYEDWSTADDIRGDRWRGAVTSAQDTSKEQQRRRAHLRLRREGATAPRLGRSGPSST